MNIKEFRKQYGITRSDLAVSVGVSITAVQNWENGTSTPSQENTAKIRFYGKYSR